MGVIPICLRLGRVRGQVGDRQFQAYERLSTQGKQGRCSIHSPGGLDPTHCRIRASHPVYFQPPNKCTPPPLTPGPLHHTQASSSSAGMSQGTSILMLTPPLSDLVSTATQRGCSHSQRGATEGSHCDDMSIKYTALYRLGALFSGQDTALARTSESEPCLTPLKKLPPFAEA